MRIDRIGYRIQSVGRIVGKRLKTEADAVEVHPFLGFFCFDFYLKRRAKRWRLRNTERTIQKSMVKFLVYVCERWIVYKLTSVSSRIVKVVGLFLSLIFFSMTSLFFFFTNSSFMCFLAVWIIPMPQNLKIIMKEILVIIIVNNLYYYLYYYYYLHYYHKFTFK